mgnify:CR=1 FL=1
MDGVPVFNLVRETLPAAEILGFRGVINATTNFILTAMEAGRSYQDALEEMQRAGIAEADPSFDIDGWDAAAKAAALINVLMHGSVTPHGIDRTGIAGITANQLLAAVDRGKRLRLVDREQCEHCGAGFAPPEKTGTEVFEPLGVSG